MEEDLKLAQALAKGLVSSNNNSRSNSPARGGDPAGDGTAADGSIKTHASMVLEKIQGFRWVSSKIILFRQNDLIPFGMVFWPL